VELWLDARCQLASNLETTIRTISGARDQPVMGSSVTHLEGLTAKFSRNMNGSIFHGRAALPDSVDE
jgi:hypothetical protein